MHEAEVLRPIRGRKAKESECDEFHTVEEARDWALVMLQHYGFKQAFIDGAEYYLAEGKLYRKT